MTYCGEGLCILASLVQFMLLELASFLKEWVYSKTISSTNLFHLANANLLPW